MEVHVEAGERTDDGARRVTFLLAANAGESRPAAGPGRVRRRAVPCDAGGARRAVGGTADPGVRRGRRRDRRRSRDRGRAPACRRSARATRCSASRTSRRWRRSPTPRSWWRRPWNREGRGRRPDRAHGGDGDGGRRRPSAWPSCRGCSRGSAIRRTPAGTRPSCSTAADPPAVDAALMARLRRGRRPSPDVTVQGVAQRRPPHEGHHPRLQPGDIAVIDHADLDRVAADGLIEAGRGRGRERRPSISGRYPNGGPDPRRRARGSR